MQLGTPKCTPITNNTGKTHKHSFEQTRTIQIIHVFPFNNILVKTGCPVPIKKGARIPISVDPIFFTVLY